MAVKRPNSKRSLGMAIWHLGSADEDYVANRTLIANVALGVASRQRCHRINCWARDNKLSYCPLYFDKPQAVVPTL